MEKVILDGVTYIKAATAAKDFKYTADYIGQLCRGKKVDARLVGRTWYVNPESIREHKKNRHQKKKETSPEPVNFSSRDLSAEQKVNIPPTLATKTIKAINERTHKQTLLPKRKLDVSYELDDESLIPTLHKKPYKPPQMIRVEPAEASQLAVKDKSRQTTFTSSELPEVTLAGKIKITPLPEVQTPHSKADKDSQEKVEKKVSSSRYNLKNKAISDIVESNRQSKKETGNKVKVRLGKEKSKSVIGLSRHDTSAPLAKKVTGNKERIGLQPVPMATKTTEKNNPDQKTQPKKPNPLSQTSEIISDDSPVATISYPVISDPVPDSLWIRLSPLLFTFLAIVCAAFIFSASNITSVTADLYQSKTVFQMANLLVVLGL